MNKLIFWGLMAVCTYKFYEYVTHRHGGTTGTSMAQVFVGPGCDQPCNEVEELLKSRHVSYELIDVSTPEGEQSGVNQYPLTRIGKREVLGNARYPLVAALAETYGESMLTPNERAVMQTHFDDHGKPLVVLYGTQWCPYCQRQRAYFSDHGVAYTDVDVEASSSGKTAYEILQGSGYPLLYVGYRRFDGYKEQEVLDAIAELH